VESLIDTYSKGLYRVDKCATLEEAKDITIELNIYSGLCYASAFHSCSDQDAEEFILQLAGDFPDIEINHVWKPPCLCTNIEDLKKALEVRLDYLIKILPV